jgi:hypothetical protein
MGADADCEGKAIAFRGLVNCGDLACKMHYSEASEPGQLGRRIGRAA